MCDAGTINTTEPNALRDVVEVEGLLGKFLGSLSLPGKPPGLGGNFGNPHEFAISAVPSLGLAIAMSQ